MKHSIPLLLLITRILLITTFACSESHFSPPEFLQLLFDTLVFLLDVLHVSEDYLHGAGQTPLLLHCSPHLQDKVGVRDLGGRREEGGEGTAVFKLREEKQMVRIYKWKCWCTSGHSKPKRI